MVRFTSTRLTVLGRKGTRFNQIDIIELSSKLRTQFKAGPSLIAIWVLWAQDNFVHTIEKVSEKKNHQKFLTKKSVVGPI